MGKYGTNVEGFGGFEGGVNNEQGAPLVSTSSDGETALLFGAAALREIQAGMANGDFAIGPDDPSVDLSDENPLPYYTTTTVGAGVTAALVEDASAGSGSTLRFRVAGGTTSGNSVAISRFVPIPSTRNRAFLFVPEVFCINATTTANARVTIAYQYYELDQTTTTGTGDSTFSTFTTIGAAKTIKNTGNALRFNAPSDAAFIKVTVTCETTGTVAADSDVFVCELRLIQGQQDLWIAEGTYPSTIAGAVIRQANGNLTIDPVVNGTGSIDLQGDTDVTGTLSTTGDTSVGGTLTATGDTFLLANLDVIGDLGVTGDTAIDGTLDAGATNITGGLAVTGNIDATGSIASEDLIQALGVFRSIQASTADNAFTARTNADGNPRFAVDCGGVIEWGAGGTRDTNLYRSGASQLTTNGELNIGGGNATITASGAILGTNISLSGTNGLRHDEPATTTQTSSAAIWVTVSGTNRQLRRNSSSARYKTNIVDADEAVLEAARKVKPRHYESTIEDENGATRLGFIAEEIHEAGLTHAVGYDAEGKPETIDPVALIAALWHRVSDLEDRLKALEEA
jgi:hypothetical protein